MPIKPRNIRIATGLLLSAATLASRYALRSRTLFEFDSVDFAVALKRFSLPQVTPHVPGDILHIIGARILSPITSSVVDAFVLQSILLSIGSVLFMWRAAAWLRGERVGLIAAVLWLTTPLFWFTGCTGTAYIHEAFYCTALLYFGVAWLRDRDSGWRPVLLATFLALAIGARQNDVLFFAPAVIWLFFHIGPKRETTVLALAVFTLVCGAWMLDLLSEAGGLANYLQAFARERGFKSQSLLFGNTWHDQLNATGKVLLLLPIMAGSLTVTIVAMLLAWPGRTARFVRGAASTAFGWYALWLALPSLVFYTVIYFMKAGYLLTIVPVCVLAAAVLVDMAAIWLAERVKLGSNNKLLLSRPIITRYAIVLSAALALMNILWFTLPIPVVDPPHTYNEVTRESFARGVRDRLRTSSARFTTISNRIFSSSNYWSLAAVDRLNTVTDSMLQAFGADTPSSVVLASWWDRQAYRALSHAYVYDIQPMQDTVAIGVSHELWRQDLDSKSIPVPPHARIFILMRQDNPDFAQLTEQLQLQRLPLPEYLDAFEVLRAPDTLKLRNATFILH